MELTKAQLIAKLHMLEEIAAAREVVNRLPATHTQSRPVLVELRHHVGRQR